VKKVVPNIGAEWRAYGNWSFALKDYIHYGIVNYLYTQPIGLQAIANIVDPIVYIDRFTMPVWNIIACGDEFTLPDSPRFWWHKLPGTKNECEKIIGLKEIAQGEKHLRAMPNAEHSMACCALDLVSDIISVRKKRGRTLLVLIFFFFFFFCKFYHMLVANVPRPTVQFSLVHSGKSGPASISVTTSQPPQSATMWYVENGCWFTFVFVFVFSSLMWPGLLLPVLQDATFVLWCALICRVVFNLVRRKKIVVGVFF
jgi:PhoPQ-activated pathogenicity-related protein